jgi:hypothetical protein
VGPFAAEHTPHEADRLTPIALGGTPSCPHHSSMPFLTIVSLKLILGGFWHPRVKLGVKVKPTRQGVYGIDDIPHGRINRTLMSRVSSSQERSAVKISRPVSSPSARHALSPRDRP